MTNKIEPRSSCAVVCMSFTVAGGAIVVFTIIELSKWAFNHLKLFLKHLLFNLAHAAVDGWKEGVKIVVATAEFLSLCGESVAALFKGIIENFVCDLHSGVEECKKFAEAAHAAHEILTPVAELARSVIVCAKECVESGALEVEKLFQDGVHSGEEITRSVWELFLRTAVHESIDCVHSGWMETLKLIQGSVETLEESTQDLRSVVEAVMVNLISYAASGMHQLQLLIDAGIPVISDILLLGKEGVVGVIVNLFEYLVSGWDEAKKFAQGSVESLEEATSGFRSLIYEVVTNLIDDIKSSENEVVKLGKEVPSSAAEALQPIGEITKAITINVIDYLHSGTLESKKFLSTAAKTGGDLAEPTAQVIEAVAENVWNLLRSGSLETVKLSSGGVDSVVEGGEVPYELVKAVCVNLFDCLSSGVEQSALFALLLKEDLPDTFRMLVQDPLERFVAPKYRWAKQKIIILNEQRRAQMKLIKQQAGERIEEIKAAIRRRRERAV